MLFMTNPIAFHKILDSVAVVPNIDDLVAPTLERLNSFLESEPERVDVRLALATMLLSAHRPEEAEAHFLEVVRVDDSAVARCNLGITYLLQERLIEAVVELSKAVLMDSALVVGHLQLARAQALNGDTTAAATALEKVLAFQPRNVAAICELAALYEPTDPARAEKLYQRALELDPQAEPAQISLGRNEIERGVALFHSGDFLSALSSWAAAYKKYPRALSGDSIVQQQLRTIADSIREGAQLRESRQRMVAERGPRSAYEGVLWFLLSENLLPECFEAYDLLESQVNHWQSQTSTQKVFPYAHYRLGLARAYSGDFEQALEELRLARDYLPASKHRSLRIDEVLGFLGEVVAVIRRNERPNADDSSEQTWEACGFADAFSQNAWRQTGCTPVEAAAWKAAHVRPQLVTEWRQERISLEEAQHWIGVGIEEPGEARRWLRASVAPETAAIWRADFSGEESISLAIQCLQVGFTTPEEAKGWLSVFLLPYEAIAWRDVGFTPEEAKKWKKSGVKDPYVAKQQRDEEEAIYEQAREENEAEKKRDLQ
jgi:tetratricopeptide (TPR) repeat protein